MYFPRAFHGTRRAQRAKAAEDSKAAAAAPEVVVLYASQTGTAQEVARTIQASSAEHKIKSKVTIPLHPSLSHMQPCVHARNL